MNMEIETVDQLKKRIMWSTRSEAATIAHKLGYGWCGGVNAAYLGDDMLMENDSWVSNLKPGPGVTPSGFKWEQRLKIHYGDWRFKIKDVRFEKAIIDTELKPEEIYEGYVVNDHQDPRTAYAVRSETKNRTVTNKSSSSFKWSREMGISITYAAASVSGSVDFNFSRSSETTSTDTTGTTHQDTFSVNQSKEMDPYTAAKWTMLITSSKTTVPYTAVVVVEFSVTLDGFLRWGGADKKKTNFHKDHFASEARPTVAYKFGSASETFPEALQDQSTNKKVPWLWERALKERPGLADEITALLEPTQYEMTITGAIEDIRAKQSNIRWEAIPLDLYESN